MSGGGISTKRILLASTPSSFISLRMTRFWLLYLLGMAKVRPSRSLRRLRRQVLAHHHRRAVAMAQVGDLHLHALLAQLHGQGRDHEGRVEAAALQRLHHGREIREALRLEAGRGAGPGRVVGDRAGEVAGHGQEAHGQRLPLAPAPSRRRRVGARCQGLARSSAEHGDGGQGAQRPSAAAAIASRGLLPAAGGGHGSASLSRPSSVRMRCTARTTSGWVAARGRGTASRTSSRMRAGRSESTSTRSASCAASSMSWVTSTTVRGCSRSSRASSAAHAQAGQVVEGRERLVHEQEVGVAGQGADQLHALPHPARELVRVVALEGRQADEGEQRARRAGRAPRRPATCRRPRRTFSPTVRQGKRPSCWKTMRMRPGRSTRARAGLQPARGQVEERRLAAARRAHEGHELAVAHLELEVAAAPPPRRRRRWRRPCAGARRPSPRLHRS